MSAEDRLSKLSEEQMVHITALKEKFEQIDSLSSEFRNDFFKPI